MAVSNTAKLVAILVVALLIVGVICLRSSKENYIDVKQNFYLRDAELMNRPTYRADLPPRFYPGDYTGEIRGAQPPLNVMAQPSDPMEFSRYGAKENMPLQLREEFTNTNMMGAQPFPHLSFKDQYVQNNSIPVLKPRSKHDPIEFTRMVGFDQSTGVPSELKGYNKAELDRMIDDKYINPLTYVEPAEVLPSEDMSGTLYGKLASDPNTYVYDRLIYANQRRKLNGLGDRIRGDLKIIPNNTDWFQVSVKPHLDLTRGAMEFIGPDYKAECERQDINYTAKNAEMNIQVKRYQ